MTEHFNGTMMSPLVILAYHREGFEQMDELLVGFEYQMKGAQRSSARQTRQRKLWEMAYNAALDHLTLMFVNMKDEFVKNKEEETNTPFSPHPSRSQHHQQQQQQQHEHLQEIPLLPLS